MEWNIAMFIQHLGDRMRLGAIVSGIGIQKK